MSFKAPSNATGKLLPRLMNKQWSFLNIFFAISSISDTLDKTSLTLSGNSFSLFIILRYFVSEILFFIDSDVIIKNNALKYVSEKFRESEVNAIQGIYSHDPDYKNILTQYQQSYTNYYIWPEKKKYASTLSTCCFAIRRKVFSLFKGFNTGIKRATCEDEEFGYNLIEKGFKTIILRELVVDHRVHYSFKYFIRRTFNRYTSHMKSYLRNILH